MSEIAKLLRYLVQADKEFKVTKLNLTSFGNPTAFTSQLTTGYDRKGLAAYNNSNSSSGEVVWGGSDAHLNGMPIPKGSIVDIPVSDSLSVYFDNTISGEHSDIRIIELA